MGGDTRLIADGLLDLRNRGERPRAAVIVVGVE
jgi:hypothetical protein